MGKPQKIEAPAQSRPLSDLTKQLGGAGALGLGGALGGQGGGRPGPGGAGPPRCPAADAPDPAGAPGAPERRSGGSGGDAEAFQRYADCLDKADPQDTAALQRCSELLVNADGSARPATPVALRGRSRGAGGQLLVVGLEVPAVGALLALVLG